MHCDSAKEIWDKHHNVYEGDAKVHATKLQTYIGQFEQLKLKEDEDIATYFLRVDETMNAIKWFGEEVDEYTIVQKVLRSLPMRFDPKILSLEEREYLATLSMDKLHGILIACEMRTKKNKQEPKSKPSCNCSDDSDEDE